MNEISLSIQIDMNQQCTWYLILPYLYKSVGILRYFYVWIGTPWVALLLHFPLWKLGFCRFKWQEAVAAQWFRTYSLLQYFQRCQNSDHLPKWEVFRFLLRLLRLKLFECDCPSSFIRILNVVVVCWISILVGSSINFAFWRSRPLSSIMKRTCKSQTYIIDV